MRRHRMRRPTRRHREPPDQPRCRAQRPPGLGRPWRAKGQSTAMGKSDFWFTNPWIAKFLVQIVASIKPDT